MMTPSQKPRSTKSGDCHRDCENCAYHKRGTLPADTAHGTAPEVTEKWSGDTTPARNSDSGILNGYVETWISIPPEFNDLVLLSKRGESLIIQRGSNGLVIPPARTLPFSLLEESPHH
jgi:hypothetical protein